MSNPSLATTNPFRAIISLVALVILSWLILHLIALLGIFLALAYPIWWIFFPQVTACLLCRALPADSTCPFCHHPVHKNDLNPHNFTSVLKNSLLILIISLFSLGVVYGESRLLYQLGFPATPKTAEFVIPPKGQYRLGEIFPLKLEIVGLTTPINAVQTDLGFDPRKLQIVEISTQDSFANIFIQKEIDNSQGYARLTGGLPNPGFFSDHGTFGTVYFKGVQPGLATIDYLSSSLILANDGRGTNILRNPPSISYLITPEAISQSDQQLQSASFSQTVLGTQTRSDQLLFYPDTPILGTTTELSPSPTPPSPSFLARALNLFARLNDTILRFWAHLLHLQQ